MMGNINVIRGIAKHLRRKRNKEILIIWIMLAMVGGFCLRIWGII